MLATRLQSSKNVGAGCGKNAENAWKSAEVTVLGEKTRTERALFDVKGWLTLVVHVYWPDNPRATWTLYVF